MLQRVVNINGNVIMNIPKLTRILGTLCIMYDWAGNCKRYNPPMYKSKTQGLCAFLTVKCTNCNLQEAEQAACPEKCQGHRKWGTGTGNLNAMLALSCYKAKVGVTDLPI